MIVGSGFSQTAVLPHNQSKKKLHVLNVNVIILGHLSTEKEKSSSDPGSLYQLRNLINRRDVTGPDAVTTAYR